MWMIGILLFACFFWTSYVVLRRGLGTRLAVADRLENYTEATVRVPMTTGRMSGVPAADRLMRRLNISHSLDELLEQADLPIKAMELILIMVLSGSGLTVLSLLIKLPLIFAIGLGFLGFAVPLFWVQLKRQRRRTAFTQQLPLALQTMSNTLRVGYGFSQGMAAVARDLPSPISVEFARAQRELNLGLTVDEVLANMAHRMQSIDFDLAVSGILVNRKVGGNLAELLDRIGQTMRERVKLQAFIRILTAEQRLSSLIVIAVPIVLLIFFTIAWRGYMSYLLGTSIGHVMLTGAVCMELLGIYVIRRIVTIDV